MRVLIIDDSKYKYKQIKDSLDRLVSPWITWCKSRDTGLLSIIKHNIRKDFEPFDLIITDNILPTYDDEKDLKPYAKNIVDEIRKMGLEDLPIIVCSSDDIEECDYNYKIGYNASVSLDEMFRMILTDMTAYQMLQESEKKDCRTCQNMSCRVESNEKPVEDCLGYINHEEKGQVLTKKRKQLSNENN